MTTAADDPLSRNARRVQDLSRGPGARTRSTSQVRLGEVHALAGENGAGKITLMKILTGVYKADPGGTILLDGEPVVIDDAIHARALGISIIYQELSMVENLTVAENIFLAREQLRPTGFLDKARMNREAARGARHARDDHRPDHTRRPAQHRPEADDRDRQGDRLQLQDSSSWTSRPRRSAIMKPSP